MSANATTFALSCPRCGGSPDPEGGPGLLARCGHCGVLGRIDDDEGRNRLVVMPGVSAESSVLSLERGLHERGVSGTPRVIACETVFLPYWRVTTTLAGRLSGERPRVAKVIERTYTDEGAAVMVARERDDGVEQVKREIERLHVALVAACPMEELGVPTLDSKRQMPGALRVNRPLEQMGEIVVFHPALRRQGTFLDPLVPRHAAIEEARVVRDGFIQGLTAGMLAGARAEIEILSHDTSLIFYPMHAIRFESSGVRGTAASDATNGTLVSIRMPLASTSHADRRFLGLLALALGGVSGSLAHLALLPPALLASPDAIGLRVRLAAGAAALLVASMMGLRSIVRRLESTLR